LLASPGRASAGSSRVPHTVCQEERIQPGRPPHNDIGCAVANEIAAPNIDAPIGFGLIDHPGFGFRHAQPALVDYEWTAPVVSHWGISGGRFPELAGPTAGEAYFIQTYSFFDPQRAVGQEVLKALKQKYPQIKGPEDVVAPVGTANAYDAMRLLAFAIEQAGSTDADAVRTALEDLKRPYEG
jgi:Periplasmic binding protein